MARVLIVGCGCRGQALARELAAAGHAVRGSTRDHSRSPAIAAAGAEPWIGDPGRLATLTRALEAVTVVCWLLGTARGEPEWVADLHDARLGAYLRECVDTTVRGFVYEAAGTVGAQQLACGRALVTEAGARWGIPVAVMHADPSDFGAWIQSARGAVESLLGPPVDSPESEKIETR
jgi:nucleoside-diphosphate-sugar epimerase